MFTVFLGPFVLTGIVAFVLDRHFLAWGGGVIAGAAIGAWVTLRGEGPIYLLTWQQGAEGERKTGKALRPIERAGIRVFHDIPSARGNYDHIVVGRAGIFLLETKNFNGIVELRDGDLRLRRRRHDPVSDTSIERIRPRALAAAAHLKQEIEQRTGLRPWVQVVVVLWADFPEEVIEHGRCLVLHGSKLRPWFESQPSKISPSEAQQIAQAVADVAAQPAERAAPTGVRIEAEPA